MPTRKSAAAVAEREKSDETPEEVPAQEPPAEETATEETPSEGVEQQENQTEGEGAEPPSAPVASASDRFVWTLDKKVYGGSPIEKGQVVVLGGFQNDAKLIEIEYLKPVAAGTPTFQCMRCGVHFIEEMYLRHHQNENCPDAEVDLDEEI